MLRCCNGFRCPAPEETPGVCFAARRQTVPGPARSRGQGAVPDSLSLPGEKPPESAQFGHILNRTPALPTLFRRKCRRQGLCFFARQSCLLISIWLSLKNGRRLNCIGFLHLQDGLVLRTGNDGSCLQTERDMFFQPAWNHPFLFSAQSCAPFPASYFLV